jgi:hypothetical protein
LRIFNAALQTVNEDTMLLTTVLYTDTWSEKSRTAHPECRHRLGGDAHVTMGAIVNRLRDSEQRRADRLGPSKVQLLRSSDALAASSFPRPRPIVNAPNSCHAVSDSAILETTTRSRAHSCSGCGQRGAVPAAAQPWRSAMLLSNYSPQCDPFQTGQRELWAIPQRCAAFSALSSYIHSTDSELLARVSAPSCPCDEPVTAWSASDPLQQ